MQARQASKSATSSCLPPLRAMAYGVTKQRPPGSGGGAERIGTVLQEVHSTGNASGESNASERAVGIGHGDRGTELEQGQSRSEFGKGPECDDKRGLPPAVKRCRARTGRDENSNHLIIVTCDSFVQRNDPRVTVDWDSGGNGPMDLGHVGCPHRMYQIIQCVFAEVYHHFFPPLPPIFAATNL
jgi:hypothetical protein